MRLLALMCCCTFFGCDASVCLGPPGERPSGSGGHTGNAGAGAGGTNSTVGGTAGGQSGSGAAGQVGAGGTGLPSLCTGGETNFVPLRRLTRGEFERTISDVLGVPASTLSSRWPASLTDAPFSTFAAANPVEEADLEQMILAAEAVALSLADRLPVCAAPDEAGCARAWLEPRAKRLLRQAQGDVWVDCAAEGGQCALSGSAEVRFGSGTTFSTRMVTGSTACTSAAFGGDPAPNTTKRCSIRRAALVGEVERLVNVYSAARRTLDARESLATAVESMLLQPEFVYLAESREGAAQWQMSANETVRRLSLLRYRPRPD